LDEVSQLHHPKFRTFLNQLEVEITLTSLQFTKNSRASAPAEYPLGKVRRSPIFLPKVAPKMVIITMVSKKKDGNQKSQVVIFVERFSTPPTPGMYRKP